LIFSITLKICDLIYDINLNLSSILYSGLALFIYGLTVGSITYLSGSIFAKTSQAAGVGAAVAIIGYIFDSVYKTVSSMNFLKYISLHYYYNDNKVILNGFDTFHLIILLIIILASFFIGIYIFNKRDIKS
jgi:ABC-2 type transport system permease protein